MSSKIEELRNILKHKKHYELKELKDSVKVFNDSELIILMLELLKEEINNFNSSSSFDDYKYLFKCFQYFDYWVSKPTTIDNIQFVDELQKLKKKINNMVKVCNRKSAKGIYTDNEFVLERIINSVDLVITNYECAKSKITVVDEHNVYDFLKYLIFDIKKFNYVEEIFRKFPDLTNSTDNGISLFDELINQYIKQIDTLDGCYNMVYLKKVINCLIYNPKFKVKELQTKKIIERLFIAIDNLKRFKCEKQEKEKIKLFLNELISDIKKVKINDNSENIDDINYKYDMHTEFSSDALEQMCQIRNINGVYYRYFPNKYVVTIDSDKSKSLDDAFSLEVLPNGNYLLGIYISDVSSYVKADTHLDLEAYERGKTIYLPGLTIPMFPPALTYNIFSLNTDGDKPVVAHLFEFSPSMNLINYEVNRALVTVNKNLTYTDTNNILDNGTDVNDYKLLKNMLMFSEKLKSQNISKDLYHEIKEIRRSANDLNRDNYDNSAGSKIVEEFMVLVNHFIAHYFFETKLPFIYRINLSNCDKKTAIKLREEWNKDAKIENIMAWINQMYEPSTYSIENLGHQGLNLNAYAHTTIPIRNYAALVNQRLIKRFIVDEQKISDQLYYQLEEKLSIITQHLNERSDLNVEYTDKYIKILSKKYKSN